MNLPSNPLNQHLTGTWLNRVVLVVGLGVSGEAAAQLLQRHGAKVTVLDEADTPPLRLRATGLIAAGVNVELGTSRLPSINADLVVVSPGVSPVSSLMRAVSECGWPVIGELELGFLFTRCPNISITGTNGKTTTTELVARMLEQSQRNTLAAGNIGLPLCRVAEATATLDYVTLEISSFQLETIQRFRPSVAILLNLTPDHFDRYANMTDYIRAKARLFSNQTPDDWAIIQYQAWQQLQSLGINLPSRLLTFSAREPAADLWLKQGVIVSRVPEWPGPLFVMSQGRLRGPHNAENLMAALATGRVLGLPAETVAAALATYAPAPHRCELIAEIRGVRFINDSKATNVDAVRQALLTVASEDSAGPTVWLIAGGKDKGFAYDDLEIGPLLAKRVKRAILIGEARAPIRAAWNRFVPCTESNSLLEAVFSAAREAMGGDVVLLSPACSSFDMFQNYQHRGEVFRQAVMAWKDRQQPVAPERIMKEKN